MTQEAMKLALEALEADELDMVDDGSGNMVFRKEQAITAVKEALAQPQQEPVAWVCMKGEEHDIDFDQSEIDAIPVGTFLYTTPPQRTQPNDIDLFWRAATTPEKWVRLTAEEVLQCWEKAHEPGNKEHINAIRMADEVEQALKEKNCG